MAAQHLSLDPRMREAYRTAFEKSAEVTTRPTAKGVRDADWMHEFFPAMHLAGMKVAAFHDHLFALVIQAESEGYLEFSIDVPALPRLVADSEADTNPIVIDLVQAVHTEHWKASVIVEQVCAAFRWLACC